MQKSSYPKDDKERLYVSRKEEISELAIIEGCINSLIQRLLDYNKNSKQRLITAANCSSDNKGSDRKTIKASK